MTHEQQIIAGMAHTRIDAAKRALTEGETMTAKHHLKSAISKIEMVENIAPANPSSDQKCTGALLDNPTQNGTGAVLEIEATTKPHDL